MCTNAVFPVCDIAAHIITLPPPNLSTSWIQLLAKCSFRRRYTLALPSPRFNRNRDSSLNQTVLQRCCGHTLCVRTHWRRVKTTALTGRLALIPALRRRLRTVWSEILRCPGIAAAVDVTVVNLSRKWRSRIWRSWAGVVTLGRPNRGRSCVEPCCWYLSQRWEMLLWETFSTLDTCVWVSLACNRPIALLRWSSLRRGVSWIVQCLHEQLIL
jgi:hypothetical protein